MGKPVTLEVSDDQLARLTKIFSALPDMESELSSLDQILSKIKEAREAVPTVDEVKKAKASFNKFGAEMKDGQKEFEKLLCEAEARLQALRDRTQAVEEKEWTWQRITWAIVASISGGALAWWLNEKKPMINHMAAGVAMGRGMEYIGLPKEHSMWIGGAAGSLLSQWAGGQNGAAPVLSIAMAAGAYGEALFAMGESMAKTAEGWTSIFSEETKSEKASGKKGKKEAA